MNQLINHSINRLINHLINQLINHAINQSTNQSTLQSINHPVDQSINKPTHQPINQSIIPIQKFRSAQLNPLNLAGKIHYNFAAPNTERSALIIRT
jgi:hypothetical protein